MTNLRLLDTGYLSNTISVGSQTQAADEDRAGYTGSAVAAFDLNVNTLTLGGEAKTEAKPVIESYTEVESTLTSTTNRVIKVNAILSKDIVTSGYNKNILHEFLRFERTIGLKLFYPSDTSDITKYKTVVEALGAENTGGTFSDASPTDDKGLVSTTTPYVVGRVKNIKVVDDAKGTNWKVTFDFELSG